MLQRITSTDFLTRAIRVVLVFALVFWSSFRAETLAFATVFVDNQVAEHADNGDKLSNVEVWQVTDSALAAEDDSVLVVKAQDAIGTARGENQARELRVNAHSSETGKGSLSFVAIPVWNEGETATITYTAGEVGDDEEAPFEDQVHKNVKKGDPTPEFDGTPKRKGYAFDGWDPEVAEVVTETVTYTAKWKKADDYTVTYTDGASGEVFDDQVYGNLAEGDETPRFQGDYTREGYDFAGWSPAITETVTGDATYVAQWTEREKSKRTVTYLDFDGNPFWSAEYDEGDSVPACPSTPQSDSRRFTAWVDNGDGTFSPIGDEQRTVYYVVDGSVFESYQYFDGDAVPSANTPQTHESGNLRYTFAYWDGPSYDGAGNPTYTAVWTTEEIQQPEPEPEPAAETQSDTTTRPAPAVTTQADRDVTIANFMRWEVDGPAQISVDDRGVATLTGTSAGRATVRCYPDDDAAKLIDEAFEGDSFRIEFDVQVVYVSSLELYSVETDELVGGSTGDPVGSQANPLPLSEKEAEDGYAFRAVANVSDGLTDDETVKFESTQEKGLSQASDGLLEDLVWRVYDEQGQEAPEDVATIQDGLLKIATKDPVTLIVRCMTPDGENGDYSENVYVTTDDSGKERTIYQGEDHHQDALSVIVQSPKVKLETSNGRIGQDEEDAAPSQDVELESGDSADANYDEATATYDASLTNTETGKQLDINEKEYTMSLPVKRILNGETTTENETVTASGRGTTLALLLADAGVSLKDQKDIEYIEFGNVEAKSTRVEWSDLVNASHAEASYVMVAIQSYVHEPERKGSDQDGGSPADPAQATAMAEDDEEAPGAGDGAESAQQAAKNTWLDNTRFQIMFDESDAAPALTAAMPDLRWVNTITVHMKGAEEPEYVDGLRPRIAYDPVPKGVTALLTAVPPASIGGANFGYKWERSTDEGKNWEEVSNNTQQTIHVPTDDDHLGNYYRVTVVTDDGDSQPSKAVMIQEGDGMVVQLDYIPPYAGDWANFTSHLIGADENDPNVTYRWEQSTDGCQTWAEIPDETGKTLRVRTNPVSAADTAAEEGGDPVLTYIRVVAILGSRSGVSGPQLLTVKVGENPNGTDTQESDGNDVPKDTTPANNDDDLLDDEKAQEIEQYIESPGEENDDDDYVPAQPVNVVPLEVTYEEPEVEAEPAEDEDESDSSAASDEEGDEQPNVGVSDEPVDLSKVIVDDKVSEKIREQNRQQAEQSTAVPGARWTEISAVNATSDDVRRVLAGNPFAPLAVPTALGVTAAGLVEKLLAFRRQIA